MPEITYFGAVLAGLLSFFTPCILPMVPFFLSYMAGVSVSELRSDSTLDGKAGRRLVFNAVAFALGVTTIFVLLGLGATTLGGFVVAWKQELTYLASAILAVFGLHFLGVLHVPILYRQAQFHSAISPASVTGAYVMGLAFGFGWTPCVGPALTSILLVAGGMDQVWKGGALLFTYGLGMTAPFVGAALFAGPFLRWAQRNRTILGVTERLMGALLLVFAVLIATGSVTDIAAWMLRVFPSFQRIL